MALAHDGCHFFNRVPFDNARASSMVLICGSRLNKTPAECGRRELLKGLLAFVFPGGLQGCHRFFADFEGEVRLAVCFLRGDCTVLKNEHPSPLFAFRH